jgi:hypothetical protein
VPISIADESHLHLGPEFSAYPSVEMPQAKNKKS